MSKVTKAWDRYRAENKKISLEYQSYSRNEEHQMKYALVFWGFVRSVLNNNHDDICIDADKQMKNNFLRKFVNHENKHIATVAKFEMFPDGAFRKQLWRGGDPDYSSNEALLRRMTVEQRESINMTWNELFQVNEQKKQVPTIYKTNLVGILLTFIGYYTFEKIISDSNQDKSGRRYKSKRALLMNFLWLDWGIAMYYDDLNKDRKVPAQTFMQTLVFFFSKKSREESNNVIFTMNKDDGLYYFFYRFVRSWLLFKPFVGNYHVEDPRAVCPAYWVTTFVCFWFFLGPLLAPFVGVFQPIHSIFIWTAYVIFTFAALTHILMDKSGLSAGGKFVWLLGFVLVSMLFFMTDLLRSPEHAAMILSFPTFMWCVVAGIFIIKNKIEAFGESQPDKFQKRASIIWKVFVYCIIAIAVYGIGLFYAFWFSRCTSPYDFVTMFIVTITVIGMLLAFMEDTNQIRNKFISDHPIGILSGLLFFGYFLVSLIVIKWASIINLLKRAYRETVSLLKYLVVEVPGQTFVIVSILLIVATMAYTFYLSNRNDERLVKFQNRLMAIMIIPFVACLGYVIYEGLASYDSGLFVGFAKVYLLILLVLGGLLWYISAYELDDEHIGELQSRHQIVSRVSYAAYYAGLYNSGIDILTYTSKNKYLVAKVDEELKEIVYLINNLRNYVDDLDSVYGSAFIRYALHYINQDSYQILKEYDYSRLFREYPGFSPKARYYLLKHVIDGKSFNEAFGLIQEKKEVYLAPDKTLKEKFVDSAIYKNVATLFNQLAIPFLWMGSQLFRLGEFIFGVIAGLIMVINVTLGEKCPMVEPEKDLT